MIDYTSVLKTTHNCLLDYTYVTFNVNRSASVCSKILEHIIQSQIMRHLDIHQILSDQQHGFRKKRSCESQLILTVQDLAAALEENEQMDAILLDFSKAFD